MATKEYIIEQINTLPPAALDRLADFIAYQKFTFGMYDDDTAYLNSIPGMAEKIKQGIDTPLSECKDITEVWPDV